MFQFEHPVQLDIPFCLLKYPVGKMLLAQGEFVLAHVDYGFVSALSAFHLYTCKIMEFQLPLELSIIGWFNPRI